MPERKRRPAVKRTAAKRTPAKKTSAEKPVAPADEPVTDDAATPEVEDEGTPPAEQSSADEAVEATDETTSDGVDESDDTDEAVADEDVADETAEDDAAADEPAKDDVAEGPETVGDAEESENEAEAAEPESAVESDETDEVDAVEDETPETTESEDTPEPQEAVDEKADDAEKVDAPVAGEKADEPEDEPAPLVGRARLFDALTHFRRGQVAVAVLLCLLGYAAVVQVQTNTEDSTYAGLREQELIDILSGLAGTTQKAQEQIEELEATRDELEDQTLQQQTALQRAEEQVDTLRVIAGTVPVSGPGITIEIDPGADPLRLTALLDLIEELRTSGAEAMEIEGADGEAVRLVASSSIEVSQPTPGLNVSGELISPPYRLQVIGPPDTLAGAIDFYQGPQDQLEEQGAEVEVESEEKIDIESIHTVSR
ncbi:DUF881 domain-containing protein [Nocardioides sp. KC13]|uniref:DUF881 domain-containing protein n=1 Tax=Nocardioides turkmenicus TaxID=2711220 RepID=A0A6M1RBN3_9ACTN|nr:DUF881 domain-containing protein [Nocardioides sp. KC13]NGN94968.1 DUF881 domain-containing protein [Nocardioides sp. KC13]